MFVIFVLFIAILAGCAQSQSPHVASSGEATGTAATDTSDLTADPIESPLFVNVSSSVSLDFQHQTCSQPPYFMPCVIGSGMAIFDFDNDEKLDVYLLQNVGPNSGVKNQLFRHEADGTFRNVSAESGLDVDGFGMGVAAGDVNNDGKIDLFVTEYGNVRLFLNRSDDNQPRFVDISTDAGIESILWGTSACFTDYDRDGWLDIVLVNYLNYDPSRWCADGRGQQEFCGPDGFAGRVTYLFHNLGLNTDGIPTFEDVTIDAGFAAHPGPGLGVYCADFDGDRWPDIFVANDGKPNHLWMNQRDGTFKEEAAVRGIGFNNMGKSEADMGIAIGDVNSDGRFDLFVTHLSSETHTLWLQQARGTFLDQTANSGLTNSVWRGTGFGTVMADFDNDGGLDLAVGNGGVTRVTGGKPKTSEALNPFWVDYSQREQLFLNSGDGKFRDVSPSNDPFCNIASVSRGLACADFDDDGGVDLIVMHVEESIAIFRNQAPDRGNYLIVKATDPALMRDAYGAEIYVEAAGKRWMRWINPGYSFLCSNDPRAHFGLGSIETYDAIEVIWPDGSAERFNGGPVNRVVHLERGMGTAIQ